MAAKKVFFKRRGYEFSSQKECEAHFKKMREKYSRNIEERVYVNDIDDINDLKDFLEDYYGVVHLEDFKEIKADYLLDNCKFYLAKSIDHSNTKCFYIEINGKSRDFATSKFYPQPPTDKQNFSKCCRFIIEKHFDKDKKKEELDKLKSAGKFDESKKYKLYLVKPKWKEIIDSFIEKYQLSDKLADTITPNGSDKEIPRFMPNYQFLEQEFIEFFKQQNPEYNLEEVSGSLKPFL